MAALELKVPSAPMSAARACEVFTELGLHAPPPHQGEELGDYIKRVPDDSVHEMCRLWGQQRTGRA